MNYGTWLDFQFPYPKSDWREVFDSRKYGDLWIKMMDLEDQIKEITLKIFQERPSLP